MQKSFNQSAQLTKSFVTYTWFESSLIYEASPIFDHAHPIFIKVTFSNFFISTIHSGDTEDFRIPRPKKPHTFLTPTIQKLLK